jgi:hypothetical protein
MKNILIPTDFTIKSLKLINQATARFQGEELHITLVHALETDHSISGLLMLNKRLGVHRLYTEEFVSACEVLRNKYASVVRKIKIEFYYGNTKAYRNHFLDARRIDAILLPEDYKLNSPSAASRDQLAVWDKSNCPVFYEKIQFKRDHVLLEEPSISELLQV